ncbi:MAG: hypothetical protein RIQ83_2955 [Pseudomonadota bacterium]
MGWQQLEHCLRNFRNTVNKIMNLLYGRFNSLVVTAQISYVAKMLMESPLSCFNS